MLASNRKEKGEKIPERGIKTGQCLEKETIVI